MRKLLAVVILALCAAPALAVGKVSTDPNTNGVARVADGMVDGTDSRLLKKINGNAECASIAELLDAITKYEGIAMRAGRNSNDWQVRDRKISIFSNGATLAELMNSIAHVMKFKWERSGEPGKWTYRLYMDRRTLLDAEAQRVRAEEKQAEQLARQRANAFDQYLALDKLTDAEKAKLRTDNPFMYLCATAGVGDGFSSLSREIPAAADAVANGRRLELSGDVLSPAARAALIKVMRAASLAESQFNSDARNRVIPDEIDPKSLKLSINPNSNGVNLSEPGPYLGQVTFGFGNQSFDAPIVDPDGGMAKLFGNMIIEGDASGRSPGDMITEHWGEFAAEMSKVVAADYGGEPVNDHPVDPALDSKIDYTIGWPMVANAERDLAQKTKLTIVSDYFPGGGNGVGWIPGGQTTTKAALDKIGDVFIYNWQKRGNVIELRDRNWFRKRAAQIPDAWLQRWRNELKTTGRLDIDSLADIAQLTAEQIAANIAPDDMLKSCSGTVQVNRELLRFYGSLSDGQHSAMKSSGLDIADLSAEQLELARLVLDARDARFLRDATGRRVLCLSGKQDGNQVQYTCTAQADNVQFVVTKFATPTWQEPQNAPKPVAK